MTIIYLPGEISAIFADTHHDFPAIIGKPSDDDMQRLCRRNFQALQDINLGGVTNATGLILSEVNYKAVNANQAFSLAD